MLLEYNKDNSLILLGGTWRYEVDGPWFNEYVFKLNSMDPNAQWTMMSISLKAPHFNPYAFLVGDEFAACD